MIFERHVSNMRGTWRVQNTKTSIVDIMTFNVGHMSIGNGNHVMCSPTHERAISIRVSGQIYGEIRSKIG